MTKKTNYILWTLQGLLALAFLFAGGIKLLAPVAELTKPIPLPGWFVRFLGVAEVLGAVGMILPGLLRIRQGLTPLAAIGLTVIMAGATVFNLIYAPVAAVATLAVGLAAGFVAYRRIAGQPDSFRVERTRSIQAPAERIFEWIADFHEWPSWSPFEKLDPAMKRTFSGASSGKGAAYTWSGNRQAGEGRMEILETVRPSKIVIKLDILKPFEGHNTAEFRLESMGESTAVTWAMYGPRSVLLKTMCGVFDMDQMIGKEFAAGLENLKAVTEKELVFSR